MKKYFIASVVAVMAFAFAAFAASLNVDGGVIQFGTDDDLTCTDGIDVSFVGYEGDVYDASGTLVAGGGFTTARLTGLGASACDNASVYLRIFDANDTQIWRSIPIPTASGDTLDFLFKDGQVTSPYQLYKGTPTQLGTMINSVDIERVDVKIQR